MRLFGTILAGGLSRRMGQDKALVPFHGKPLISHIIARFAPQVEALALSANGDPTRFSPYNLPILPDTTQQGPLSGLLAALLWAAPQGATAVITVPIDGPFLPPDLVPRLLLATNQNPALAASPNGLHPTFGLWPVTLAEPLAAFLASGAKPRLRDFAALHHAQTAPFPDDLAFANANTPSDLAALEAR